MDGTPMAAYPATVSRRRGAAVVTYLHESREVAQGTKMTRSPGSGVESGVPRNMEFRPILRTRDSDPEADPELRALDYTRLLA